MKRSLGRKTLILPSPTWVIGTYDADGEANAMTAAWGGICCSKPPSVCVSLREATYTYRAIVDREAFTVNVPAARQVKQADYLGIASGRDADKLAVAGLTAMRAEHVDAPAIAEFPLKSGVRVDAHGEDRASHAVRRQDPRREGRRVDPQREGPPVDRETEPADLLRR